VSHEPTREQLTEERRKRELHAALLVAVKAAAEIQVGCSHDWHPFMDRLGVGETCSRCHARYYWGE
jgi:hypothetical protein